MGCLLNNREKKKNKQKLKKKEKTKQKHQKKKQTKPKQMITIAGAFVSPSVVFFSSPSYALVMPMQPHCSLLFIHRNVDVVFSVTCSVSIKKTNKQIKWI